MNLTCYQCRVEKPIIEFAKHPTGKHGVNTTCKSCRNEYRRQYYINNREKSLIDSSIWSKNNLHKKRMYRANRRALVLKATPKWANTEVIKKLYKEADSISKFANYCFEVDHIIPLQGKNVCGLHVENNLQIISMVQNRQKAVRYES